MQTYRKVSSVVKLQFLKQLNTIMQFFFCSQQITADFKVGYCWYWLCILNVHSIAYDFAAWHWIYDYLFFYHDSIKNKYFSKNIFIEQHLHVNICTSTWKCLHLQYQEKTWYVLIYLKLVYLCLYTLYKM